MTSFASLMALSATHTKKSQRAVEDALQERRRKEAQQRKQQQEKEATEREQERKLLLKRFQDQEREQERLEKFETMQRTMELALWRRAEAQRQVLQYGPKKAAELAGKHSSGSGDSPNWPSSSSSNRESVRKLRVPIDEDEPSGPALTREEIRERKLQAELRRSHNTAKKRFTATGGYSKHGKKLAGGVLDIKSSGSTAEFQAGQSVRKRLTIPPIKLRALGGMKKDTRSELEIFDDIKRKRSGHVLDGDEARNFNEYFAPTKKEKARLMKQAQVVSTSATTSGADSPRPRSVDRSSPTSLKESSSVNPPPTPAAASKQSHATSAHPRSTSKQAFSSNSSTSKATIPKISKANTTTPRPTSTAHSRPKRPRSPSLSRSPPPKRRHIDSDISSTIWKMFGKDRQQYTSRNVLSDDEDMEVDASILEREEAYSARIAKREDMLALQQEERHEEEKRKRKREKDRAAARSQ